MELSLGMVLQISIYVLTGSAVALMVLDWHLSRRKASDAQEHSSPAQDGSVLDGSVLDGV